MAVPVPVPKQSLFKKAVADLKTKGLVETSGDTVKLTEKGKAVAAAIPLLSPAAKPKPKPAKPTALDEMAKFAAIVKEADEPAMAVEDKPAAIDVVIPTQLYHMIMSKPTTGGGWQGIMAQLQAAFLGQYEGLGSTPGAPYVLHLSPWLLAKIVDKATIGSGGYQAVMRWVVCLAVKQHPGILIAGKGE